MGMVFVMQSPDVFCWYARICQNLTHHPVFHYGHIIPISSHDVIPWQSLEIVKRIEEFSVICSGVTIREKILNFFNNLNGNLQNYQAILEISSRIQHRISRIEETGNIIMKRTAVYWFLFLPFLLN